ncbi:hypothetical protein ACJJTC_012916 [Scirpophaga incertulas]
MSINPLNELKRRLEDSNTPLPKRLCLAKNVIQSHFFPVAPKERVVADWLHQLTLKNKLAFEDLKNVIGWLTTTEEITNELNSNLVQIVANYLRRNPLHHDEVQCFISFLESQKILSHLSLHIEDVLFISVTLLQFIKSDETLNSNQLCHKIFNCIVKCYKESKKKLEFITKLLEGENLETLFSYLDTDLHAVLNVCQNILFPVSKKTVFASYLQTLIRKDNIDNLISEKGDNIQSVLKIMNTFFSFPKGRSNTDHIFLCDFIDVFVSCYHKESQIIYAFYVMVINSLNMKQDCVQPTITMEPIELNENTDKKKRNIFLNMLSIIHKNDVDINVRLSDTLGVKVSKIETKKTFIMFLESVMMGQLKTEGKPDKDTFQIVKTALKLDPSLIESKIAVIIPALMTSKKNSSVADSYREMLNYLLETFFKLSRGTTFLDAILPLIKNNLETNDNEQEVLSNTFKIIDNDICEKSKTKFIKASNIFPEDTVELYGKLTFELMFRQNKELLLSLQNNFEELALASEGEMCPSIVVLTEIISGFLTVFFKYCKMADHTVPTNIAEEFWSTFSNFELQCMKKFGQIVIHNNYCKQLLVSFLKLCLSISHLKILNLKYSNTKLDLCCEDNSGLFDLTMLLPCLTKDQWNEIAAKTEDEEATLLLDELLLMKIVAIQIVSDSNAEKHASDVAETKNYLIKQSTNISQLFTSNNYLSIISHGGLDINQSKQIAKIIVKQCLSSLNTDVLKNESIVNNTMFLKTILIETLKNIMKNFQNAESLSKAIGKTDFKVKHYAQKNDMKELFKQLKFKKDNDGKCIERQISCIILPLIVKHKKHITASAHRSILADLQEKLQKSLLDCFRNINFTENGTITKDDTGKVNESTLESDSLMATLNAISAYSLTLSKYCESSDIEEAKNLDCLWTGLEYFVKNAINSVQSRDANRQHVDSSLHLLNSVLRYIKKLDTHQIFQIKDKLFIEIWDSIKARLSIVFDDIVTKDTNNSCLEDVAVTIKFLCEWVSVEGFTNHFVSDLKSLSSLEIPSKLSKTRTHSKFILTSHRAANFLWTHVLKANIIGAKCVALSKLMYQNCRNLIDYVHQYYEVERSGVIIRSKKKKLTVELQKDTGDEIEIKTVKMDDIVCEMLKVHLETLSVAILSAKKINIEYKILDSIFETQQSVQYILGCSTVYSNCETSWSGFFGLFEASVVVLNNLIVAREALLEDRWPCYMQCYRALTCSLCKKASSQNQLERHIEENLGELAHSIEMLTQSLCKRRSHVARIAAYSVADLCSSVERYVPTRNIRQHLENSIALLIQVSDTSHAMAFVRRALAGSPGQMTMSNMYTMYKRYHKYVGNA